MKKAVNIWCDGSFREAHKTAGAGWVIKHVDGQIEEKCAPLPRLQNSFKYGSEIAELVAATHAMNALPAGSNAQIHMDCQSSLDIIAKGQIRMKGREEATELKGAFEAAMAAKARLGQVTFQLTSDRNENMHRAHVLSQTASSPPREKNPGRR
ncbi:MAG: hypothetical protein NDJ24_06495 [Alphaproteobacteria bacterium]|nr:hypothetical protein [Alphaproteobacteria bacterium]